MDFIDNLKSIGFWGMILAIFGIVFLLVFYIFVSRRKEKTSLGRGMNLALFLVTLPQRIGKEKEEKIPLDVFLKSAEQFFSSLTSQSMAGLEP